MSSIPVLEIGGTHVSAAVVDADRAAGGPSWTVTATTRLALDSGAAADELLGRFLEAGRTVPAPPGARWGIAMPDPFDYERGIGRFEGVGKFESLNGVDVGASLRAGLRPPPAGLAFVNDADAFTLGEWAAGAAAGAARCVGITLGTGVGSGWLVDGRVVDPGDPPGGRAHRLLIDGRPLEDVMSRRAIRRAYAAAGGDAGADVRDIAAAARAGEARADDVLRQAVGALGRALGPVVRDFGADVVVVGGSMTGSWDLLEPLFRAGAGALPDVRLATRADDAPLIGAAVRAARER